MYDDIKNNISNLTNDQVINLMLIFAKEASSRDAVATKEAITLALKNGIFHADSYKSLGYEDMAISFGLAFIEVQEEVRKTEKPFTTDSKESLIQEVEEAMKMLKADDGVYH
jgi:translation elongation factor EF-1beta